MVYSGRLVLGTLLVKRCENFPRAVHIGSGTRSTDFLLFTIAKPKGPDMYASAFVR